MNLIIDWIRIWMAFYSPGRLIQSTIYPELKIRQRIMKPAMLCKKNLSRAFLESSFIPSYMKKSRQRCFNGLRILIFNYPE